ncbi:MAG: hypothetical protein ACP5LW_01440 [Nitrososphaeria archaeon]
MNAEDNLSSTIAINSRACKISFSVMDKKKVKFINGTSLMILVLEVKFDG